MSQFDKYHPSGNLKFNNLGIFQSLKLRILMEKFLSISLKLNFAWFHSKYFGLLWVNLIQLFSKHYDSQRQPHRLD